MIQYLPIFIWSKDKKTHFQTQNSGFTLINDTMFPYSVDCYNVHDGVKG